MVLVSRWSPCCYKCITGNMISLKTRANDPEIMDDLQCNGVVVDQTLRELEIINKWLGGTAITIRGLEKLIKRCSPPVEKLRIADLGCGGGDMLKEIALWARNRDIEVELWGFDANTHILDFARKNTRSFPEITFEKKNLIGENIPEQKFHILLATLFTHHFESEVISDLLKRWQRAAIVGMVINDIHRHWISYLSIKILTHLFSRSDMVKYDAPLSVARSFKKREWQEILERANIKNYELHWAWAFRWQLSIFNSTVF